MSHRRLLVALLSVLLLTATAVVADSTLTRRSAIGGDQRLVSPGDTFQLGLFPVANDTKWFLGIWFTVSPTAVIWVANRDRPLNASSSGIVTLSGRGDLVLLDAARNNETVWSSNSSAAAAAIARLNDNGNLVLADAAGAVVWQSFEHPTNTFVSEMRSGKDLRTGALWSLSSWRGADDPSPGDFRYVMDTSSGSPELHVWSKGRKTYRTGPWNGARFSGIPEMTAFEDMFEFRFTRTADEVSYVYRDSAGSPVSRVVLNESGVMERMVWNRAAGAWSVFWSGPRDQCDRYGLCGAFGVCNVVDAVVCGCVRGFRVGAASSQRFFFYLATLSLSLVSHARTHTGEKNSTQTHTRTKEEHKQLCLEALLLDDHTVATCFSSALSASLLSLTQSSTYIHKDPCTHATTATSWSHSMMRMARPLTQLTTCTTCMPTYTARVAPSQQHTTRPGGLTNSLILSALTTSSSRSGSSLTCLPHHTAVPPLTAIGISPCSPSCTAAWHLAFFVRLR